MYIKYKDTNYPCDCRVTAQSIAYSGLTEDFPAPVDSEITLFAETYPKDKEDFVMRTDNPADYLRQTFNNGILTLTNIPEVEPEEPTDPIEPEPTDTEVLNTLLGVIE